MKTQNLKLKTKNYLITGGAGFLGYHLVKNLLKTKNKITILDIAKKPTDKIYTQTTYIQGDVRNKKDIYKAIKNIDVIIHTAAALPLEPASTITSTTINGTRNLLQAIHQQQLKINKFSLNQSKNQKPTIIYISSTAVYGVPTKHPIEESDPLVGVGPYGHAKITAEKLCEKYRKKGLCISILRPKTFIGTERLGVFQILCNWVRLGKRIPVIGNGNNLYQLLDVDDLVSAILWLTNYKPKTKKTTLKQSKNQKLINQNFNVGAEKFSTVNKDVGALCNFAGNGSKPFPVPSVLVKPILRLLETVNLSPLYRWIYDTADKDSYVSIEKLKKLGWKPKYSNSQSLIKMYKWYTKHYQEFEGQSGTTHRVGWNQGALKFIKKFL